MKLSNHLKWWRHWSFFYDRLDLGDPREVLQVGPGRDAKLGLTIDINPATSPDVLHDLNVLPWPVAPASFRSIVMFSVLEHLDRPLDVLQHCHDLLKPGGVIVILVPHFSNAAAFVDPTHRVHFSARSFDYMIEGTELSTAYGFYARHRFRMRTRHLSLMGAWRYVPLLERLANRHVALYENHFCYVVRGEGLYVELEKVESP